MKKQLYFFVELMKTRTMKTTYEKTIIICCRIDENKDTENNIWKTILNFCRIDENKDNEDNILKNNYNFL